jgi:hypothetical protein
MASNTPAHNAHRRARRADLKTWPAIAISHAKYRAKKAGIPFAITVDDIPVPARCPVLNIPLIAGEKPTPNSPSIDRTDNSKGYVPGNVRVISRAANLLKGECTVLDIVRLLEYMTGRR